MDALRSVLPAGTLSGAPKVRAMQIIDELEPVKRGGYGGAIGYLSYGGDLDTAIHIRTVVVKDGVAHVQAGGGTVADAKPAYEYEESVAKAQRGDARDRARLRAAGVGMRVLVLDNYDSFTYNLVQYLGELRRGGATPCATTARRVEELLGGGYERCVISPGPCTPERGGHLARGRPAHARGGRARRSACASATRRSRRPSAGRCVLHPPVHGKATTIEHDGRTIFSGLRVAADGRALPLARRRRRAAGLPGGSPRAADGVLMALRHRELPAEGVQFHPESVLTEEGRELLGNFLAARPVATERDAQRDPHAARSTRSPRGAT